MGATARLDGTGLPFSGTVTVQPMAGQVRLSQADQVLEVAPTAADLGHVGRVTLHRREGPPLRLDYPSPGAGWEDRHRAALESGMGELVISLEQAGVPLRMGTGARGNTVANRAALWISGVPMGFVALGCYGIPATALGHLTWRLPDTATPAFDVARIGVLVVVLVLAALVDPIARTIHRYAVDVRESTQHPTTWLAVRAGHAVTGNQTPAAGHREVSAPWRPWWRPAAYLVGMLAVGLAPGYARTREPEAAADPDRGLFDAVGSLPVGWLMLAGWLVAAWFAGRFLLSLRTPHQIRWSALACTALALLAVAGWHYEGDDPARVFIWLLWLAMVVLAGNGAVGAAVLLFLAAPVYLLFQAMAASGLPGDVATALAGGIAAFGAGFALRCRPHRGAWQVLPETAASRVDLVRRVLLGTLLVLTPIALVIAITLNS